MLTSLIEDAAGLDCAGEETISDTFSTRVTFLFLVFPHFKWVVKLYSISM
jgi:hypothetical protein